MIILVSILINLPFVIQIFLLFAGLIISVYGVYLLVKMVTNPVEKTPETPPEKPVSAPKKKKGPTSTL